MTLAALSIDSAVAGYFKITPKVPPPTPPPTVPVPEIDAMGAAAAIAILASLVAILYNRTAARR